MRNALNEVFTAVGDYAPNLLAAVLVLVVGWIVALALSTLLRQVLHRTKIDNRIGQWVTTDKDGAAVATEQWISRGVFYLLMIFVLAAFFYTLRLPILSAPLEEIVASITSYLPRLLAAAILVLIAWVVATAARQGIRIALKAAKLDERLNFPEEATAGQRGVSDTVAEATYWVVLLLFLPAILGALQLHGLLEPVTAMLNKLFAYLPQLFAAAVLLLVGWFVARIVRQIVVNLLVGAGVDAAGDRWGLQRTLGAFKLSALVGMVLYYVILVPVVIAALNALQIEAITKPASDMLGKVLGMLPAMLSAALLLLIAFVVGRLVSALTSNFLGGVGFNNLIVRLGLATKPGEGDRAPAALAGKLVLLAIMLLAGVEAASLLGFGGLSELIKNFITFAGHVLTGGVIFVLGILLANWVAGVIRSSDSTNATLLATAARVVILLVVGAMALRQMELANDIVNLAFGLTIGAVALATALAFGLGGRDTAARCLEDWRNRINTSKKP